MENILHGSWYGPLIADTSFLELPGLDSKPPNDVVLYIIFTCCSECWYKNIYFFEHNRNVEKECPKKHLILITVNMFQCK